eukprot:7219500-Pyramimonas_sp.AAC.1
MEPLECDAVKADAMLQEDTDTYGVLPEGNDTLWLKSIGCIFDDWDLAGDLDLGCSRSIAWCDVVRS